MIAQLALALLSACGARAGELSRAVSPPTPPASPGWVAALSPDIQALAGVEGFPEARALSAPGLTAAQQSAQLGPVAKQLELMGQTPVDFSSHDPRDRAALAGLAVKQAADDVDREVWKLIQAAPGAGQPVDEAQARAAAGQLSGALEHYAPYLSRSTARAAALARDAYAARAQAARTARALGQDGSPVTQEELMPEAVPEVVEAADAAENESIARLEKAGADRRAAQAGRQAEIDRARQRSYDSTVPDEEWAYAFVGSMGGAMIGWGFGPKGAAIAAGIVLAGGCLLPLIDGVRALKLRGWKTAGLTALMSSVAFGIAGVFWGLGRR